MKVLGRERVSELTERSFARRVRTELRRRHVRAGAQYIDDPASPCAHRGQHGPNQPCRREVVYLHDALKVVKTLERIGEGASDRAASVVDENVDRAVTPVDRRDETVARLEVGEVDDVALRATAGGADRFGLLLEFLLAPRDQENMGVRRAEP